MTSELYRQISYDISRLVTQRYSTSFSLGINMFPPLYRRAIYAIYGFVRFADEIVDTYQNNAVSEIFAKFKVEVSAAIRQGISTNPILESFQDTVHCYSIPQDYIAAFLHSMEMDLTLKNHTRQTYEEYIYGSAEVIGLMCLKVFCHNSPELFPGLIGPARRLGGAFQKVNFLRDLKSDLEDRGRIYLPGIKNRAEITDRTKEILEAEIADDFNAALPGIPQLPCEIRLAVFSVFLYYTDLYQMLKKADITMLLSRRMRISNFRKILLLGKAAGLTIFNKIPIAFSP
jgi:15-cis-phytoene synthase